MSIEQLENIVRTVSLQHNSIYRFTFYWSNINESKSITSTSLSHKHEQ